MKRRSFLKGILAAVVTKALPSPCCAGRLVGDVASIKPLHPILRSGLTMAGAVIFMGYGLISRDVQ